MAPTLRERDVLVVNFWAMPRQGEVVLVRWAERPTQLSVKRTVRPTDQGWHVEGDNAFGSTDSRELGPAAVLGVIRWRLWPGPGPVRRKRTQDGI